MKEIYGKKSSPKYSEMIMEIYEQFDDSLPEKWTTVQVFEICIEAWNLALKKSAIGDKMYKDILSKHKQDKVINRMVNYKNKHFKEFSNYIIDFSTTNNILQVKSQPPEEYFKSIIIKSLVTIKKAKK
ncbi:hypothetical protein [Galbibacter orientalis]|uniref:hypothetical protein n=1 Tax=Galbibacter orientalis TaxID=453852 RepID=UPI00308018BF